MGGYELTVFQLTASISPVSATHSPCFPRDTEHPGVVVVEPFDDGLVDQVVGGLGLGAVRLGSVALRAGAGERKTGQEGISKTTRSPTSLALLFYPARPLLAR